MWKSCLKGWLFFVRSNFEIKNTYKNTGLELQNIKIIKDEEQRNSS